MQNAQARIIASSTADNLVCAAAGRISTTQGTALEVYARTKEKENNASLIEKVVGSGHTSTLEHQFFTVAFDSVSVFTEEFVIEFRLGSLTITQSCLHWTSQRRMPVLCCRTASAATSSAR